MGFGDWFKCQRLRVDPPLFYPSMPHRGLVAGHGLMHHDNDYNDHDDYYGIGDGYFHLGSVFFIYIGREWCFRWHFHCAYSLLLTNVSHLSVSFVFGFCIHTLVLVVLVLALFVGWSSPIPLFSFSSQHLSILIS